ncbi:MAG: glycosyltransferase family 39 protein [Deltaproteobacteria bacterium]|nr:glycosyltransferase family 39 protein [Deltaproteobacteria bacterium]
MSKKGREIIRSTETLRLGNAAFVLILLCGAGLRLWGIGAGLPFVIHPDENRQVLDSLGMASRLSLLPEEFSYPALHKYLLMVSSGAYFLIGRAAGWFADPSDFALRFLTGGSEVFLIGRLLSAAAGTVIGVVVYKMGRRLYGETIGLIGFAYSMGMFHLIQHSQWAIADIFIALFTITALHFITACAVDPNDNKSLLLGALFAGLAVSTKPQGAFLAVPLALSQFYALKDSGFKISGAFLRWRAIGALIFVAAGLMGNLSWIFEFRASLEKFTMLSQVAHLGISSREPFSEGLVSLIAWFARDLVRQEGPLGAVLIAGVVYTAVRRTRQDLIMLSYVAVFFFALRDWAIRYLHLFVAIMPALTLLGGRFTGDLVARFRLKAPFAVLLVAAIITPSAAWSIEASLTKESTDTRLLAKRWVEENIEKDKPIAVDWYEFAVPLWSKIPPGLLNPKAAERYEKSVPERVRKGYNEFLKTKRSYTIVPVIYSTDGPKWPAEMTAEAREKASGKEVYRELYTVFNFRTVDELEKAGAKYLIITSYGYTNFLLDNDPYKTNSGAFNYLFREDLIGFNRQADKYVDDGRFGLIYFLNKRARDFYSPLLHGGNGNVKLVKEFIPARGEPGPVIKIFKLGKGT